MGSALLHERLFLDGYGSSRAVAEDLSVMEALLCRVNEIMFRNLGKIRIIPVLGDEKPRNNGVSGIVLALGGHFTCHTFSRRDVFFADAASASGFSHDDISKLLETSLRPRRLLHCTENPDVMGFGKHLVLRIPRQTLKESDQLISAIVSAIRMTNLCERMYCACEEGASIIQPITESHVSIHNAGLNAALDIFSCKHFNTEDVMCVMHRFGIIPEQVVSVGRGLEMEDKIL